MANLCVNEVKTKSDVICLLNSLHEKNILDKDELKSIRVYDILTFLNSGLAKRMAKSGAVRREVPFVIGLNPQDVYLENDGLVLVNGIIDCFFEEDDGCVLVDYKTDYVNQTDFEQIIDKYSLQLSIYKKAVEYLTQKPVVNSCLYLTRYGKCLDVRY
jgi:ATP-dependent helicase/nuclease subunit A